MHVGGVGSEGRRRAEDSFFKSAKSGEKREISNHEKRER